MYTPTNKGGQIWQIHVADVYYIKVIVKSVRPGGDLIALLQARFPAAILQIRADLLIRFSRIVL